MTSVNVPVPCHCDRCGFSWASNSILGAAPGVQLLVSFEGNTTTCPQCGTDKARIIDGTYDAAEQVWTLVSDWSAGKALRAQRRIQESVLAGDDSDSTSRILHSISDPAGELFDVYRARGKGQLFVWTLLFLLVLVVADAGHAAIGNVSDRVVNSILGDWGE